MPKGRLAFIVFENICLMFVVCESFAADQVKFLNDVDSHPSNAQVCSKLVFLLLSLRLAGNGNS